MKHTGKLADLFSFPLCAHTEKEHSPGVQKDRGRQRGGEKERDRDRAGEGAEKADTQASAGPDSATRQGPQSAARIQEWVAFPFSRQSSQPRDQTQVSCIAGRFFIS